MRLVSRMNDIDFKYKCVVSMVKDSGDEGIFERRFVDDLNCGPVHIGDTFCEEYHVQLAYMDIVENVLKRSLESLNHWRNEVKIAQANSLFNENTPRSSSGIGG